MIKGCGVCRNSSSKRWAPRKNTRRNCYCVTLTSWDLSNAWLFFNNKTSTTLLIKHTTSTTRNTSKDNLTFLFVFSLPSYFNFLYICCFATVFYPSFLVIIIYVCFPLREYPHTHTVHNKKDSEKGNFWAEFDYKNGQYGMIRYDLSFTTTSNLGVLLKIIL